MTTTMSLPIRVLYLEDNAADAELVADTLAADGLSLDVLRVDTADAFKAALKPEGVDLILSDHSLPSFNGIAALAIAREKCPEAPFIFISGTIGEDRAIEALKNGATDYVLKQRLSRLVPATRRALAERSQRVARQRAERALFMQYAAAHILADASTVEDAVSDVLECVARAVGADVAELWSAEAAQSLFRCRAVWYEPAVLAESWAYAASHLELPAREGLLGCAAEATRTLWAELECADAAFRRANLAETLGLRHVLAVPVRTDGGVTGVIALFGRDMPAPAAELDGSLASVAAQVGAFMHRKESEEELRRSEIKFRSLADTVPCAIFIHQGDRCVYVNQWAETASGYRREEFLAAPFWDFVHPDFREMVQQRVRARQRGEAVESAYEVKFLTRSGEERWMQVTASRIEYDGKPASLGTAFDITERKRTEEALRESQQLLQAILDGAQALIYARDRSGRLLISNRRFQSVSQALDPEGLAPNLVTERLWDNDERVLRSGQPLEAEEVVPQTDGPHAYLALRSPLVDADGRADAVCCIATDVTERKRAQEELRRQRETLAQTEKLAAMGSLLAGVAHELNNPLAVVLGQAGLLERRLEGDAAQRAARISKAAERCARIVTNFLALARQRPPERRLASLNQVVEEALELLAYPLRVEGIEVVTDLAHDLPPLWADAHQLHQVIVNLVTNAHHALRKVAQPRLIVVTTRAEDGQLHLSIADNGPGIPPELRSRIFEPFFTTKPPGEGTGLGLSLCHGIVASHGGRIEAVSGPGGGALFRIELPRQLPGDRATSPARESEPARPPRGARLLVVDDEPELASLIAEALREDGHRVDVAGHGLEALEKLRACAYDLVVSDIKMPRLDGPELYREATREWAALRPRFVFVTGDALAPETQRFVEETKSASLSKPFRAEDVQRIVRRSLCEAPLAGANAS